MALDLPEEDFLKLSASIVESRQEELIPLLISLLENLKTPQSIEFLKYLAQRAGAPLIRSYCNLALLHLQESGPYESFILDWIDQHKNTEMIRFRPILSHQMKISEKSHSFELTPEEHSRLLILAYQILADQHRSISIDILLEGLEKGHVKNRSVLAGLLIYALQ
ncbi:MAG: hypothetical protein HYZ48_01045 [Chlamydiales bacterium]|nr:hypothetical protein [Chlamydiales bacterium]